MSHSKGSCDDAMSSNMFGAQDLDAHDESSDRVLRRRDVVRHAMPKTSGAYDESFERVLRRCDVVRHAMLFRVYDESLERVLRRCDVVKHAMLFRFWGFTLNHSKGSCGDARSLR